MRDGQAGLSHPPWRGGGVGEACLQGFLKGSEHASANKSGNHDTITELSHI